MTGKTKYVSFKRLHWLILIKFFTLAIFLVQMNATDFQASVIPTDTAPAFDGTFLPVLKAPKWASLAADERDLAYDQMPAAKMQALPVYDPNELKTSTASLGWSDDSDLKIRNAKITFSVPYMGNYQLDGIEYAGSHLAVDLKLPSDTPVYSIGNGVVSKVAEQNTGFGNHIVVRHDNFPSLNNPSAKETLYSSYSHLGQVLVADGDVVLKGQLIGKSGDTGTSSTPHLHFQMDNSDAPWHPYWPFTFQESSDAGLSFSEAVNAGLGADKALKTTINPMLYVQKFLGGSSAPVETLVEDTSSSVTTDSSELPPLLDLNTVDEVDISVDVVDIIEEVPVVVIEPAVKFAVVASATVTTGTPIAVTVKALYEDGNIAVDYMPVNDVEVQILEGNADFPNQIKPNGFVNGVAKFIVTPTADTGLQIKVTDNVIFGESDFIDTVLFKDLTFSDDHYKAVSFLKSNSVIGGYPDGTFRPEVVVSRVEALKFILNGVNSELLTSNNLPFADTFVREWYSDYVATAYEAGVVDGYPDRTFKPGNTVNRAEFLKMLLTAMDVEVDMIVARDVYTDVSKDDWFAPYVQFAKSKNLIVLQNKKFRPEEGMTRGEVSELIYKTIVLKVSGARKYSSGLNVSGVDVSEYFS